MLGDHRDSSGCRSESGNHRDLRDSLDYSDIRGRHGDPRDCLESDEGRGELQEGAREAIQPGLSTDCGRDLGRASFWLLNCFD